MEALLKTKSCDSRRLNYNNYNYTGTSSTKQRGRARDV